MPRPLTGKVIPQTVPNHNFIFDDAGNGMLDILEFHCVGYATGGRVSPGSGAAWEGKAATLGNLTGTEMRRGNTGCGGTVIGYRHRRNNVAFQQGGTPEIANCNTTVYPRTSISQHRGMLEIDLRDHRCIATRANTNDSAG